MRARITLCVRPQVALAWFSSVREERVLCAAGQGFLSLEAADVGERGRGSQTVRPDSLFSAL